MTSRTGMKEALRDHNFLLYLGAIATFNLAGGPGAFLPLYLQHQVGLAKAVIVWLQLAGLAGAVATSYFWGWVTDRYGGKPAMLTALPASVVIPVFWFMIPRQSPWSTPVAALLFGLGSALGMGWVLGTNRLLFVKIVPPERKTQYMAVNYAWMGIIGVAAPLLPGWALDHFQGIRGSLGPFPVDQYSLLWAGNSVLAALTFLWVIRLRTSGELGMREFTGLFVHGNPLLAAEALVRYSFATEERTRLSTTEMMGRAKSPLHVEELVEGLHDPSFNVRHEAIVALAHMQPDERATAGLVEVLQGRQPDLAVAAAWALGRIGDRRALEPLRQALEGDFPMVQAASARALGTLRDEQAAPLLLERLPTLPVPLRTAYAAALGAMRYRPAVSAILELLREPSDSSEELTLALARIMGAERHFIHLWRSMRTAPAAGAAAEARGWRAKLKRRRVRDPAVEELVARSERAFAVEQMAEGTEAVNALLEYLAAAALPDPLTEIMSTCRRHLLARDREYRDCLLLALHAIGLALNYLQPEGATEEAPPALPPTPRLGIDKRHN
jgi:HEAT repeat protein